MPEDLPDDFDFLLNGVIDSFGLLELISTLEEEFRIRRDLKHWTPNKLQSLDRSRYVAENAKAAIN